MLKGKAILLPQVSQIFLDSYTARSGSTVSSQQELELHVGDSVVKFSSKWLLHQLIIHLNPYIEYKCVHKKYGAVLYRKSGDILTSLSWALGAISYQTSKSHISETDEVFSINKSKSDLLHEEIDTRVQNRSKEGIFELDIKKYTENINPMLLLFLTSSTFSIRKSKSSTLTQHSPPAKHTKLIRQYFILA